MKRILLYTIMCLFGLFSLNAQEVPQNLVATANGLSSITLTWDAVEGAEDYYVYKDGQLWANTSGATTYTENGLAAGTECCFAVQAVGAAGESELSAEVCATTEAFQLAENEIVIGNGNVITKYYSPFLTVLGGGSWFEAIYKSEEIGQACTISELAFSYKDGAETSADINIYLAETAKDEYTDHADVTAESELTLVYSGNGVILCDEEWETFVLNAPFNYSGENNLVVVVTTANTSKANNWNCYEDANSVLIKDVFLDSKKPVLKLTLGEGGETPDPTPDPEPGDVCVVEFILGDSYGDGWNGNTLVVTGSDGVSEVLTVNTGSSATYTLEFAKGAHVTLLFTNNGGSYTYPQENSLIVRYESGIEIINQPEGSLTSGLTFEFDVDCTSETPEPEEPVAFPAPQNLVATVNGQNSITVTWDAVEGAEDYYVYKDGTMWANTSGATTYTENGLAAGTECCFAVQAVGAAGESELSAEVCATTESIELAENEIIIGTATTKYYSPFLTILGGGSWFEAIYKSEEIGKACTISELAFSYKDGNETSADINIYLAETTKDEYANPNDATAESELTLVYSGTAVTLCDEEWETFVLNAPFNYSGENNLVVVVTTANTSKANNWNCYEDANSVLIKDVFLDSKKPVLKLTLGEGGEDGNDVPSTPKPYRLVSKVVGDYSNTSYIYDNNNRVVEINNDGMIDYLSYNAQGQLESYYNMIDSTIVSEVNYVYDTDNRLVSYTELAQSWNGFIEVETEITYDAEGKVDKVVDSYGTVMTYEYNAEGLLIEKATGYEYDGIVEYDSKEAYTYQNGKLEKTEYLYYDWYLADGSFTLAEETVYEYDENSNCVLKEAYMVDENNLRTLYQTTEYYYNTTVSAEDVYTFEYPHFAFTYPVKPSSENVLTKEVSYYSYVDEATGEVVNHSHTYTTYNYDPEILSVPFAPTNLVATAVNTLEIVLSWDAVEGADYYNVYYDGFFVGQTSETTFLFGSFGVNIEHCFEVVAENAAGVSEPSDMACVTTYDFDDVCYVYFELADTYGDGWNGNYLEVAYNGKTQKLEMTGGSSLEHVLEIPTGSYVTVTYIVSQGYTWPEENSFVVRYENGAKILDMASGSLLETTFFEFYVDCSTAAPTAPEAPQNLVATAEGTSITLTWDAVVGAEYYAIYYFEDSTFNYYGSVSNPIGYIHNRVPGVTYCFTVTAINEAGESGPSNEACAMVEEQVSVIDIEVEVLSATSARVIATPNEATAEYHYIVINKSISDYIGIDSTMQFLYDDPYTLYEIDDYTWNGMEANTEYYVVARGQNAYGEWGEVTIVEFTTLSLQIPEAPTNLVAEVKSSSEIQLSWDDVEGAEYYNIYSGDVYLGYIAIPVCIVSNVEYGTHCYTVTAVNEAGESEHSNEACATIEDPIKVHNQALTSGWNWYSTYVVNEGANGLVNLENAVGTSGIQIKNQIKFVNQAGGNWYGTLEETSVEDMFMIQLSSATNVTLEGYEVNPAEHPITLGTNWKWISYPVSAYISVEEAFASANPSNGDYVKSQTGFAQYYDGLGWSGTLKTMTPGLGYMYQNKSGYAKTLVYPSSSSKGSVKSNVTTDNNHWTADYSKYPMNMTMIAVVEGAESAYEVAAFADGECRGSARPIYVEALDSYIMFMTISGEDGETLTFKYYDVNTGETYAIADEFTFSVNATVGDVMEPYVMTRGAMGIEELASSINIYPNPVDNELFLATEVRVEEIAIYDVYGRKTTVYGLQTTDFVHSIDVADLDAGVYFVNIKTENGNVVKRFIKK